MKLALSILASAVGYSAAAGSNPFAPKVTANTAKASLNSKLMRGATPVRKLQDEEEEEVWELDLSTYSIKFEKCQFVKQYAYNGQNGNNNNNKNNQNAQDILTVKHFVVFRLCPDNACETCNYKYGEYIIDMESYLAATLEYKQEQQENYCESCNQCIEMAANAANGDEANEDEAWKCTNIDTSTCYTECQNIENMEANGYVDASDYAQCVKLNSVDANGNNYYAGGVCSSSTSNGVTHSRIKIGVFTDQYCTYYDDSVDITSVLTNNDGTAMSLSYHLLKETFDDSKCIASCVKEQENNNNQNNNGEAAAAEVNELCGQLYETSGKCESAHGFADGMITYDDYDNQMLNEELVCNFITAVKSGTYDMTGEIVITGGRATVGGGTTTTGMQKFSLTFFILGSVGLAGYAAMMHSQLTKGAKADLSRQGGAMA
jgi:hypothetical protein